MYILEFFKTKNPILNEWDFNVFAGIELGFRCFLFCFLTFFLVG